MSRSFRASRKRWAAFFAACGLFGGLGLLVCDRLANEDVFADLGVTPTYAITETGNHILVEVVSPILY